jgi:hypothetical protein
MSGRSQPWDHYDAQPCSFNNAPEDIEQNWLPFPNVQNLIEFSSDSSSQTLLALVQWLRIPQQITSTYRDALARSGCRSG